MDNRVNEAYLIAIINDYERQINKGVKTVGNKETFLKDVVTTLGSLLDFMMDKKATDSKSTLELNKDLTENVRAYKDTLADKERAITRLNTKNEELHELWYSMDKGKLETENKMLEAENLELKSRLAMTSVSERTVRELKAENESIKSVNNEQREKNEVLKSASDMWSALYIEFKEKYLAVTGPMWWMD